jgi:hypothetical protein
MEAYIQMLQLLGFGEKLAPLLLRDSTMVLEPFNNKLKIMKLENLSQEELIEIEGGQPHPLKAGKDIFYYIGYATGFLLS